MRDELTTPSKVPQNPVKLLENFFSKHGEKGKEKHHSDRYSIGSIAALVGTSFTAADLNDALLEEELAKLESETSATLAYQEEPTARRRGKSISRSNAQASIKPESSPRQVKK